MSAGSSKRIRIVDSLIVTSWLLSAVVLATGLVLRLAVHLQSDFWTTLWESGPLMIADRLLHGQPIYGSTATPPVHVAVYGPWYYRLLSAIGWLVDADRLQMIDVGRWTSVISLAVAVAASMVIIRRGGGRWWACLLGGLGLALLTPTAVRFCGSTRPDAPAAAFSMLGLALGVSRIRFGLLLAVICFSTSCLIKQSSLAGPIALMLAMGGCPEGRRPSILMAGSWFLSTLAILGIENQLSNQTLQHHWAMLLSAPKSWGYALDMVMEATPAHEVWVMLAWAGIIALLSAGMMRGLHSPNPAGVNPSSAAGGYRHDPQRVWYTVWIYFVMSLALAVVAGIGQGSDQNYLIEPALAMGPLIGIWASRVSSYLRSAPSEGPTPKNARSVRMVVGLMLFNPLILRVNDYFLDPQRELETANLLNGYGEEAPDWLASLPQPTLSLDPWLAYLSGGEVWINDTVAYGWAAMAGLPAVMSSEAGVGKIDGLTRQVRQRAFTNVVLSFPLENASHKLHRDIVLIWPTLAQAIDEQYQLIETYGRWYRYELKPIE